MQELKTFMGVAHPSAKYAEGWGTRFIGGADKKQVLRFAQDDKS